MKDKIEISEKNEEEKMKNIEELSNVKKKYTDRNKKGGHYCENRDYRCGHRAFAG